MRLLKSILLQFQIVILIFSFGTLSSFALAEETPWRQESPHEPAWTCSVLCGYYLESAITYDPSQDIVIASGNTPTQAYRQAQQLCVQALIGNGKFRERDYPILVIEQSTASGATTVRATVSNACVKN